MGRLYSAEEIAKMVSVTAPTIIAWSEAGYIPKSSRVGVRLVHKWSAWKVERILQVGEGLGYAVKRPYQFQGGDTNAERI